MSPTSQSLPIQCLSLNHRSAPDALRERVAFTADTLQNALQSARRSPDIERLVIVSTCERVELYASVPAPGPQTRQSLAEWLAEYHGVDAALVSQHADYYEGMAAARHLARVTAGLDATLLGEAQILTQVASAISTAVAQHAASPVLKAVFRTAVQCGERARGQIWSQFRRADIGSIAIDDAHEYLGPLAGRHAVVVGAGAVAQLALPALRARGVTNITICNRTPVRVADLAQRYNAHVHDLTTLPHVIRDADIVLVATGAAAPILHYADVAASLAQAARPLVIIDTAMPRNVDPSVRTLDGVHFVDLENLQPRLTRAREERLAAIPDVEAFIEHDIAALTTRNWATRSPAAAMASWNAPALCSASA